MLLHYVLARRWGLSKIRQHTRPEVYEDGGSVRDDGAVQSVRDLHSPGSACGTRGAKRDIRSQECGLGFGV